MDLYIRYLSAVIKFSRMLALTPSRQSVKYEDKNNSKPSELLRNANLQAFIKSHFSGFVRFAHKPA